MLVPSTEGDDEREDMYTQPEISGPLDFNPGVVDDRIANALHDVRQAHLVRVSPHFRRVSSYLYVSVGRD